MTHAVVVTTNSSDPVVYGPYSQEELADALARVEASLTEWDYDHDVQTHTTLERI